jgi:hypothetical protein
MGAFFLYRTDADLDERSAREVFQKKGFQDPRVFPLARMTLWLYRKQLIEEDNYYFVDPQTAVFATGTIVYRGKSYREGLVSLLDDFQRGTLDFDEMIGSFGLIFLAGGRLSILNDRLNVHHIFIDEQATRLSTSFLALLASHKGPLALNRPALDEKLLTGYIVGPDTLVSGIRQLTDSLQRSTASPDLSFIAHPPEPKTVDYITGGLAACVDHEIAVLRRYFERIGPLARQYGPELGLSNGYDSRLVLCLSQSLPVPLAVHSHWTVGTHEAEKTIAEQLVAVHGNPLSVVKTRVMEEQSEEDLAAILADGLYYFDARNCYDMGAYSETYTRKYKIATLGKNRLSLNGLGGEILRNHLHTWRKRVRFRDWMRYHVYFTFAARILPDRGLQDLVYAHLLEKMTKILDVDLSNIVQRIDIRRYYSQLRMPECNGVNHNAQNQMVFYLTPFIEHTFVREAYRATPYIGTSGRFEAAMITKLDRRIASITSQYGYPMTRESWRHRLYAATKGYTPESWLNLRRSAGLKWQNPGQGRWEAYQRLRARSKTVREIEESLRAFAPEIDVEWCMREPMSQATAVFVGSFLREFQGHIRA